MKHRHKAHLITFATADFRAAQEHLCQSALERGNIQHVHMLGPRYVQSTAFYAQHRRILDRERGAGYWLWKPFLILDRLRAIADGDFVVYSDCGRAHQGEFRRPVDPLLDWTVAQGKGVMPGVSIPHVGDAAMWTKRDCFVYMECDSAKFWRHPQIQATHSVWQKCRYAMDFAATWLEYCCRPELITDAPNSCGLDNLPGFVEHRHDQSILTNLVIQSGLRFIDGSLGLAGIVRPPRSWDQDLWKDINNTILRARGIPESLIYASEVIRRRVRRHLDAFSRL